MLCSVLLLDGSVGEWNLPNNAVGQELFDQVCEHLNLLERDYFGLAIYDSPSTKTWLDVSKQINKQIKSTQAQFAFSVKFYPTNPALLCEDLTRYLVCLQIRRDLLTKRLPCQSVTLIALGSYVLQSEFGPYDPDRHGDKYTNNLYLAPNQNEELLKRMREQHLSYGSMSPAQADLLFLQNASQLPLYGIDRHPAKDSDGDVVLGVCSEGILLYRDDMVESKFLWPRILKVSFKHSKFLLRTRPSEGSVWTLCFTLPSSHACKSLWKVAVEHHSFFRLPSVEISRRRLLAFGTQFHYCGRTEAESLKASSEIARPNPVFLRKPRAKSTASLEALTHTTQPEPDDWFVVLDSIPQKSFFVKGFDEGPELVSDWRLEADDWLLFQDPSKTTLMPLDTPLSNVETFQEDQEQDDGDSSDGSVEGGPQEVEITEETAEEEEVVEEYTEESRQEGEIMEIRQVKEVKIVRKIREVNTVGGRLKESKDLEILLERDDREAFELGVLTDRLTKGGILDQRLQGISDVQKDDWYILFDQQSPTFYSTSAFQQLRLSDQEEEFARVFGDKLEVLRLSGEAHQEWEIVEEPQEKVVEEGELEGETIEIRRQKVKIIRKQIQEVMVEEGELSIKDGVLSEIQEKTGIIQDQLEQLVEVEERHLELEILTESLQEVDVLEYSVQRMEQPVNVETIEDDWFVLLDRPPYIIYPAPLVQSSEAVEDEEALEMTMEQRTEEAVLTVSERSEEQVVIKEEMEERVIITEPITYESRPYSVRDVDDDLFLLLEPVPLEDRGMVADSPPYTAGPIYEPEEERILEKEEIGEVVITEGIATGPDEPESIAEMTTEQIVVERIEPVVRYIEDDWFMHFDKILAPVRTPPPVVWETLEGALDVSPISVKVEVEEESDEEVLQERQETEELEISRLQPTPTFTPRQVEDVWYNQLEVAPKETVRAVEPYAVDTRGEMEVYQSEEQTFESKTVITSRITTLVTVTEERREGEVTIMEEFTESTGDYITLEVQLPVTVRHIEDDWFILLEPTPVEVKPSPTVAWEQEQAVPAEEQRTEEMIMRVEEKVERQRQVVVEVTDIQPVIQEPPKITLREVEDDWYILLEASPKETVWVAPQYAEETVEQERVEVEITVKKVRISEEAVEIIEEGEEPAQRPPLVTQKPVVVPRDIEDDWFLLLETVPVEVKAAPAALVTSQYTEERVVREGVEVKTIVKRVRISEEEVVIIGESEDLVTWPAVVTERPPVVPRDIEDDWFLLLESAPVDVKAPPSVAWEQLQPLPEDKRVKTDAERMRMEEMSVMEMEMKRVQPTIQEPKFTPREVEDDWYTLLEVLPKETVPVKVEVVSTVRREERATEPVTITEERRVIVEKPTVQLPPPQPVVAREIDDDWVMLLDAVPLQERAVPSVEMRRPVDISTVKVVEKPRPEKILVEERLREQEIQRIPQKIFVGVREIEDDWYKFWDKTILVYKAEPRPKVILKPEDQRVEKIMEREWIKEEDLRKRVTIAEAKRVSIVQEKVRAAVVDDWFILLDKVSVEYRASPRVAPVIPPTPAKRPVPVDQPLTSTPTVHPAPIIKYIPEEEKRETQVIVKEKVQEDEELTIIRRKTRKIEGENIYVRHSILMLEDFDVTQEVVLRHHASISELKRIFMEAEPEAHLSEWDKHLSICHLDTHTQLISMEEWSREERVSIM